MTRHIAELPIVEISRTTTFDPSGAADACQRVEVSVEVQGDSAGFITLDDPADLYILRDALSEYIDRNNINPPTISRHEDDSQEENAR